MGGVLAITRCRQREGGTSHIALPDMNSYIKKYEFISLVTYEFIHMNSHVSDPCLVLKKWPLTEEAGLLSLLLSWRQRHYCSVLRGITSQSR
jgi:hypothetical protein